MRNRRGLRQRHLLVLGLLLCAALHAAAQEDLEDVFGGFGTAEAVEGAERQPGEGSVVGTVVDGGTGAPVAGATVILAFPEPPEGEARQEVEVTDATGSYSFPSVPPGVYSLTFVRSGFRTGTMTNFEVLADRDNRADFPLPPQPTAGSGEVLELEPFVAEASVVGELLTSLELRLESDQLVNVMSAEDLSRYASSDVADAVKRVAGVNVVEGQFAVIRGLEERYSSTLFNGAPVPSPDPERQSVQLDLFPSEVVSNLTIAKTFAPDSPGNSAAGSVDIDTYGYPDEWTLKLTAGSGFHDRAWDRFLHYEDNVNGKGFPSPIPTLLDGSDTLEYDIGGFGGGRGKIEGHEVRLKLSYSHELDFSTLEGFEQDAEPAKPGFFAGGNRLSGDLALGQLGLPGAIWDLTESTREKRTTLFGALGFDLDREGHHRVDATFLYTKKEDETVEGREGAHFPLSVYQTAGIRDTSDPLQVQREQFQNLTAFAEWVGGDAREPTNGLPTTSAVHPWFAPVFENRTFDRERALTLYQLNGEHEFALLEGLSASWAANFARTEQQETTFGLRYWYEPPDLLSITALPPPGIAGFPFQPEDFGPGGLYYSRRDIVYGDNDVEEKQYFARLDLEYAFEPFEEVGLTLSGGFWYEDGKRSVVAGFDPAQGIKTVSAPTPAEMGAKVFPSRGLDRGPPPITVSSDAERKVLAWNGGLKATLFDDLDLLGGLRFERLTITSRNDPFTGDCLGGGKVDANGECPPGRDAPAIYPSIYTLFDRVDNRSRAKERLANIVQIYNDQIANVSVTPDPVTGKVDFLTRAAILAVLNDEVDDDNLLPSLGFTYRAKGLSRLADWTGFLSGLTLRGAYSQTVARPSLREVAYYPSLQSGTDDVQVGNPQLKPSDVKSLDGRLEYTWGQSGDLFAFSAFLKKVKNPIERVTVVDPIAVGVDTFQTWKNNPADADLFGLEAEARFTLGQLFDLAPGGGDGPVREFFDSLSIGGNGALIDAEVDQPEIIAKALLDSGFFKADPADAAAGKIQFTGYEKKRPLTNQPKWVANADISFYDPAWGTRFTAAVFGISEVLSSTAAARVRLDGSLLSFKPDRYTGSYYQLDLVFSQDFKLPFVPGNWTFKTSVKNVTDTERSVFYDPQQVIGTVQERAFKVGRDYSFALAYKIRF